MISIYKIQFTRIFYSIKKSRVINNIDNIDIIIIIKYTHESACSHHLCIISNIAFVYSDNCYRRLLHTLISDVIIF